MNFRPTFLRGINYWLALWSQTPLQHNPHERHFGMFRHDGSAKLSAQVWKNYVSTRNISVYEPQDSNTIWPWLNDYNPDQFYDRPQEKLAKLFSRYKDSWAKGSTNR